MTDDEPVSQSVLQDVNLNSKKSRGRKKKIEGPSDASNSKITKTEEKNETIKKEPKPKAEKKESKTKVEKKPKVEKLPKGILSENEIQKVYDYMKQQNRPYSVSDVFTNLRKEVGKTNLTRIMDKLETEGKLVSKTPSKTKIFLISQDQFEVIPDGKLDRLNDSILQKTEELKEFRTRLDELKQKTKSVASLGQSLSCRRNLMLSLEKLTTRHAELKSKQGQINTEQVEKQKEKAISLWKQWKWRRSKCNEITSEILDAMSKPRKFLEEAAEIEQDPQPFPNKPFA